MATRKFTKVKSGVNSNIYQRIYENSLPEVLVSYSDYRFISANPLACSLFGMTEEELCLHFLTDLVDYSDPRLINLVEVAERTGKTNGEITLVRKNGSKFTCEINSSTFRDENEEIIIDITLRELIDRRKEEEELSKIFALYQLAIDSTNDGIWDIDMKTNRVFLSDNAKKWFGFKEIKILHRDELLDNIIHKDDMPVIEKELNTVTNGHTNIIDIEFRVNTVTSGLKWIRLRGKVVLRDRAGKIIRMLGTFSDISHHKQIERELEKSQNEFQSYFDNASVGLTVATPDKSWIAVNEKACQIFGYSKEELLKLSWVDLVHPDEIQAHIDRFNLALAGKIDKDIFDTRLIRKDGRIININLSIECYRNEDGSVHHFLASHIDTTEQKLFEKTIKDERRWLRTLVDNLPAAIYIIDSEGRKVISNRADLETIGSRTEAEVVGKTDIELFPGKVGERCHADNIRVINSGLPILNREEDFFDNKGEKKWLMTTKVPIYNSENQISGLVGIGLDITEQKSLQQKIIDSEAYYRTLINIAPDGVVVTDLEGNITFHSKKILQIFEAPENIDFIGESVFNWVAPENHKLAESNFRSVLDGEKLSQVLEYKCLKFNKTEFWGELSSSPLLDGSGKSKGLMLVCRDISERKRIETDLIAAKNKAEENDKLKTAFLHNISHEIRTPLNAIVGFSSLLDDLNLSRDQQQSYIEIINKSSDHLLKIISDILLISNIEAGIVNVNENKLDLNDLIEDIFKLYSMDSDRKNILIERSFGIQDEKVIITSDKTKLIQILSNLMSNSLKFTEKGTIKFGYTIDKDKIQFYVSDTGKGIPEQKFIKIFDRFYQVDYTENRLYEGTGLGLSICKAYVELLGGQIWLSSSVGVGTTFYFNVPDTRIIN